MKVLKAVVTAAGRSQRHLPFQSVIDGHGYPRSACRVFVDELSSAGIEEIAIVICPGDADLYHEALNKFGGTIHYIEQHEPRGYGHAVLCASEFVGSDPFVLTVGDHLYIEDSGQPTCARQLVELARTLKSPVSAVQSTHESKLPYFGAIGGKPLPAHKGVIEINKVREKPTPTAAEQDLFIPGQRPGFYQCFFGMHVLPAGIMAILQEQLESLPAGGSLPLSPALERLAHTTRYLAAPLNGRRYDLGQPYGLLVAQLAVALHGEDRETVLANLVELLAQNIR